MTLVTIACAELHTLENTQEVILTLASPVKMGVLHLALESC
jgi:hypothetical protein